MQQPNLMTMWLEIAGKLSAAGISVDFPSFLGWTDSPHWADHTGGGYYPENGQLWISKRIAHVPVLVRDVLIHEIAHQLQYAGHPLGTPADSDKTHDELYFSWASRLAPILQCPSPDVVTVNEWPTAQRPEGFFGPDVTRKQVA